MNIGSGNGYPESALSNFAPHPFELDGVLICSMEGFLQAIKFREPHIQVEVCKLVGYAAKKKGRNRTWHHQQLLYWQGVEYKRNSEEYQILLNRAYNALNQNEGFQRALIASGEAVLKHTIGRTKERETVLTRREFCSRLTKLRAGEKLPETLEEKTLF